MIFICGKTNIPSIFPRINAISRLKNPQGIDLENCNILQLFLPTLSPEAKAEIITPYVLLNHFCHFPWLAGYSHENLEEEELLEMMV
jgi:hypothetical protein